jgi:phosphoenolpyruvate carboxylase
MEEAEVDTTGAETALLLHENIENRIHEAVGRLFGIDVQTHRLLPRNPNTTQEYVRQHMCKEISTYVAASLANDQMFVRQIYDGMLRIQHERQSTWRNGTSTTQQFF